MPIIYKFVLGSVLVQYFNPTQPPVKWVPGLSRR